MKKIVSIILILNFFQMQNAIAQDIIKSTFNPYQNSIDNLNKMKFKIFYTLTPEHNPWGNGRIYKINIYKKNGELNQVIKNPGVILDSIILIQKVDVNFDKFMDFAIYTNHRGADEAMNYYIFDPKTQKFIFNKAVSDIIKPEINSKNKYILSYERGGNGNYGVGKYKWFNKKLKLVSYDETINTGTTEIIKHSSLKKGKIVLKTTDTIFHK